MPFRRAPGVALLVPKTVDTSTSREYIGEPGRSKSAQRVALARLPIYAREERYEPSSESSPESARINTFTGPCNESRTLSQA